MTFPAPPDGILGILPTEAGRAVFRREWPSFLKAIRDSLKPGQWMTAETMQSKPRLAMAKTMLVAAGAADLRGPGYGIDYQSRLLMEDTFETMALWRTSGIEAVRKFDKKGGFERTHVRCP